MKFLKIACSEIDSNDILCEEIIHSCHYHSLKQHDWDIVNCTTKHE